MFLEITAFDLLLFFVYPIVMFLFIRGFCQLFNPYNTRVSRQLRNSKKKYGGTLQKFHEVLIRIWISVLSPQTPAFVRVEKKSILKIQVLLKDY